MSLKLLDCTLRDGGYVNDWNFGKENIIAIINGLVSANIDLIEVGFLNQNVLYDENKTILPEMKYFNSLLSNIDRKNTKLVAMIELGTFDIDRVPDKKDSLLDGIRVIFDYPKAKEGFAFCKKLKEKGYMVSANIIKITNCSEADLYDLFRIVNASPVDAIVIVDTYGHLDLDETQKIYKMFDENVSKNLIIGFHTHNTLQLAVGNCLELIRVHNPKRIHFIDGTLNGMGKGAGNAYTEVLAKSLNKKEERYCLQRIADILENQLSEIKKQYTWGFSLERYISSISNVHYTYTKYFKDKKGMSYGDIIELEKLMKEETKHSFQEDVANETYKKYLKRKDNS